MIPFFSIILPTFNQADFLKLSIKSILNQTYKNWELLIINNNSKDKTIDTIKQFKDHRIRIFKINNQGLLAKSRNFGINKARSKWICFIDSDDKWFPEKLMKVKQYIDHNNGDLYYHDLVFENKGFLCKKKISDKSQTITKPILKYFAENGNPIGQSSVVVKKEILKKIGFISENKEKFSWEDFDTWIKISRITDKFIRIPIILGTIWVGPENISNLERQIFNNKKIHKYYYRIFNKFLSTKNRNKNLWWLEYPSILKDFRYNNYDSFIKRLNHITRPPFKFYLIFFCMKHIFFFIDILKKFKKFITIIILFKNKKKNEYINLTNQNYKKISHKKNFLQLKFNNFTINKKEYFDRIKNKCEFHYLYQKKNILAYGWSSKNKKFLISEIDCKIKNKKSVIFFDFFTIKNFRNRGYYKFLLKKMLNNFKLYECFIYTNIFNFKSMRAIIKSNFEYQNFYTILKKKIILDNE